MKFFKYKKNIFILIGVFIILSLGAILLTIYKQELDYVTPLELDYSTALYKHKTKYIDDISNTTQLVYRLPLSKYHKSTELITEKETHGLKLFYDIDNKNLSKEEIDKNLYSSSVVLFSLMDNLDNTIFNIKNHREEYTLEYKREDINKILNIDIREKSNTLENFKELISTLDINNLSSDSLDKAISLAIQNFFTPNPGEEFVAEGHVILDKEENDKEVKVYLIASANAYSFENEIFTSTSGYGAMPIVMKFSKNGTNYNHISTIEPQNGSYYVDSIEKMFPKKLLKKALNPDEYLNKLTEQQEKQTKLYLKSINRKAKVQGDFVDKKQAKISIAASNKLLEKEELQEYPDWIGTKESLINGIRYIYETKQEKENGYDIITYTKRTEDKRIIEEYKYKIINDKVEEI
ncbi:DUF4825 domain-containing protein [Faecalimicrobium sp. JNUCC 81]